MTMTKGTWVGGWVICGILMADMLPLVGDHPFWALLVFFGIYRFAVWWWRLV